jgi:exodeoxyribonuclease V gamma subunit
VRHRYDEARAGDYLSAWIEHLFLNAVAPAGVALRTTVHVRGGRFVLAPQPDARDQLGGLLQLYRAGLQRPLHFFQKASWTYVRSGANLASARGAWRVSDRNPYGEQRHPAYGLALRGVDDPLDDEFVELARRVFGPLSANLDSAQPQ